MAAWSQCAAAFSGDDNRQVFIVVPVAVADAGPVKDHAIIQKRRSVRFADAFHLL